MNRTLTIAVAAAALAAPLASASAQFNRYNRIHAYDDGRVYDRDGHFDRGTIWRDAPADAWNRISWIGQRLERSRANGMITNREYWRNHAELRAIRQMAWRLRERDGGTMTRTDAAYVQQRLDLLGRQLRMDRRD